MTMGAAGYGYAQPRTDGMAIAALVIGIVAGVGIFCYGVPAIILGPIAIYLGRRAQRQIKASGGALTGNGLAMAGWIIGLVAAILGVIYLLFIILGVTLLATGALHLTPSP
jgi:hypothetical protein